MTAQTHNQSVRLVHLVLNIAWFLLIFLIIAMAVATALPLFLPVDEMVNKTGMPLNLELYTNGFEIQVELKNSTQHMWLAGLGNIVSVAAVLFAVYHLRVLVGKIKEHNTFDATGFARMKKVSFAIIAAPLIKLIGDNAYAQMSIDQLVAGSAQFNSLGMFKQMFFDGPFEFIVLGLVFLVFAEVFRIGYLMKQEADLTV